MILGELAELKPAQQLRYYLGDALLELCRMNEKVVVLDGDLGNSTGAHTIRTNFPNRFFNCGIAESNLIGVSAGLASSGFIPFVSSFPSFLLCNAYDQIRLQIALARLNVKLFGSHSGLSAGREGPPTMSIEDFALMGGLPDFTILVPGDPVSMKQAVFAAAKVKGPVYIRSSREALPFIYSEHRASFEIGKANIVREGKDATIFACGLMLSLALDAAVLLRSNNLEVRVIDMFSLRPLDEEIIKTAAIETGAIVTAEEHLIRGGMGGAIAQIVAQNHPVPIQFIGLNDTYAESASLSELLEKYALTARDIAQAVKKVVKSKRP
jgi:transketolase